MANLYEIEQELLDIYNELEENGGELTPELEEKLLLTQDNFKTKLNGYVNVINEINSRIDACKTEEKRISALRKSREKSINRLKEIVQRCVINFGDINKSGNYFIELDTCKLATRGSDSLEFDEQRIEDLIYCVHRYIMDYNIYSEATDKEILNGINGIYTNKVLAPRGIDISDVILFTLDDLALFRLNITFNINGNLLLTDTKLCDSISTYINTKLENGTMKVDIKDHMKDCDITIAHNVRNHNLQIK